MLDVTFEDGTHTVINMYFCYTPETDFYPNQGTVDVDDPRWHVFFYKFPDFMREGWSEPTYVPPVDKSAQMPEVESEDIPTEDVN